MYLTHPPSLEQTQHLVQICLRALCKEVAAISCGAPAPLLPALAPRHPAREAKAQSLVWWLGLTPAKAQIQSGGLCECVVAPRSLPKPDFCVPPSTSLTWRGWTPLAGVDTLGLVKSLSVAWRMPCVAVCMFICMTCSFFKLFLLLLLLICLFRFTLLWFYLGWTNLVIRDKNRVRVDVFSISFSTFPFTCTDFKFSILFLILRIFVTHIYSPLSPFSPPYQTMSLRTVVAVWPSASVSPSPSLTPLVPRPAPARLRAHTPQASLTLRSQSLLQKQTHHQHKYSQRGRTLSQRSI